MTITLSEINGFLKGYSFGNTTAFRKLPGGYANSNFRIDTGEGPFLLRLTTEKPADEVQKEIVLLNELRTIRFPASYPVQKKDSTFITTHPTHGSILVYDFINGTEPEVNEHTVAEIAKAIAMLSNFKPSFTKESPYFIENCKLLPQKPRKQNETLDELFEFYTQKLHELEVHLSPDLPMGLIHGDAFPDNTIYQGNKLQAVIDFEEACINYLLLDIGMTANGFCFNENNELDSNLLKVLVDEYSSIRPLTKEERKLLPQYIKWCTLATIAYHLGELIHEGNNERRLSRVQFLVDRMKKMDI